MATRTYLTALNERITCPGYRQDFAGETDTIGETAAHLPLPWLAMFREEDLVADKFIDANYEQSVNSIAPITTREKAIANLKSAFGPLRTALHAAPELEAYFHLMANELQTYQCLFITIDWLEMNEPSVRDQYVRAWHEALRGFDDPTAVEAASPPSTSERLLSLFGRIRVHPWLRAINWFTQFNPTRKLPPASAYLDRLDLSRDEDKLHANLLPGNWHKRSIWMPQA